jgi:hypothetical protein
MRQLWERLVEFGIAVFLGSVGLAYFATGEARHREAGIFMALLGGAWLVALAVRAVWGQRRGRGEG